MRYYFEQRSREWFELRLGRVTSTRLKVVAHGTLAAQTKLLDTMEWEVNHADRAIDKYMEGFGFKIPKSIALGREREDWIQARWEIQRQQDWNTAIVVDRPGLITHPTIKEFASSPDWLALSEKYERTCEGKTRVDHSKHEYAIKRGLLPEDKDQVYCQMMTACMTVADYCSYCPDYPNIDARLIIVEVELDQIYANFLYAELNRFLRHFRAGTRPTVPIAQSGVPSFFEDGE